MKNLFYLSLIAITLYSCVPARQFNEMKEKNQRCEDERDLLKTTNKDLTEKNTECTATLADLKKQNLALSGDTTVLGKSLRKMTQQYDKINQLNDELLKKQKELMSGNANETRKLLSELQDAKEDLQKKEDDLKLLERSLNDKKKNLEEFQKDLDDMKKSLEQKNSRLVELESIMARKDSAVKALKDKVTSALLGFQGDGLTINQKNGKVYVSLDEKLLFKSGKWDVDPKGQDALKKLATVLEKNEDINVMIEGHTDDVPYGGSGNVADNWDLSVKRATAIVKIILGNSKVDPKRLVASGRGEFLPLENVKTTEARAKNRRTEIILTPKLDELFKILENN
jgi:chemotaxis protein MotB